VDYPDGDGGSTATFGGTFTNEGTLNIGNTSLAAATTVTTKGLNNDGFIVLAGSSGFLADFVVNGSATIQRRERRRRRPGIGPRRFR
jgi:hypothetical protein